MTAPMVNDFAPHESTGENFSVKALPDVGRINTTEAAHRQHGEAVIRLEGLGYQLARAFDRLEEATEQMLEAGVRVEPILPAHVEAAFKAWKLEKVDDEAPLPRPVTG